MKTKCKRFSFQFFQQSASLHFSVPTSLRLSNLSAGTLLDVASATLIKVTDIYKSLVILMALRLGVTSC